MSLSKKNLEKFIAQSRAIQEKDAREDGSIGFMARAIVQATLPHRSVDGNEFERKNGLFRLTMMAKSEIGIPYGVIPRLILVWISTEAVRTKSRKLVLGDNLSSFMRELGLIPSGGRWGTITRLKEQMRRLLACSICCTYDDGRSWAVQHISPFSKAELWWDPKNPQQSSIFESTLTLNEEFFNEIINHPVPIDFRAIKCFKKSSLAIDIYCWLTYRFSYLSDETMIPWEVLQAQFGSGYPMSNQGKRNFKKNFLKELNKVFFVYHNLNIDSNSVGLILRQSKPHVNPI